jgi:hypothetical protein
MGRSDGEIISDLRTFLSPVHLNFVGINDKRTELTKVLGRVRFEVINYFRTRGN